MSKENQAKNNNAPHIGVNVQYIKDLSYESPNVIDVLREKKVPQIDLVLDINVEPMKEENTYEVCLHITAKAQHADRVVFLVELVYGGIFTLSNIPADDHNVILGVQCTSMLFPYARKIVADMTQSGGFQPLMIDPIDFAALYHKKMMELSAENNVARADNDDVKSLH